MSEAALLAALSSSGDGIFDGIVEAATSQPEAQSVLAALDAPANPPSPTKRQASLEPEVSGAKRIKVETSDESSLAGSEPVVTSTSMPTPTDALMTAAVSALPPTTAPSATPTTTATSALPAEPVTTSTTPAPTAPVVPKPQMASSAPANPPTSLPTAAPTTTTAAAAAPATPATPIPSIEKSPSVKPEPGKHAATPDWTKENATPEAPPANANVEAPPAAAPVPPRKRRRMQEAPGQALRAMKMQSLGIQAVQVLEWLSQEPFEDVIDSLRDVESDVYASYSFKVTQFEQAWMGFSMTEDLLEWSKMGLGDQKHRKTVRLANLARFAIDLFSEDETCLPSLHERFFRVFVYGTRKFSIDHSNILLELKTQLALHLLEESKETPAVDVLHEVFLEGLEDKLKERSWDREKFNEEATMLTSSEIRMSLLLQEYEESGNNTATLAERYPYDNLLRQLGSYMHSELVAHSDHCQTLVFSSRTAGKRPTENRSLAYQDDDDYWQRTTKLIDDAAASIVAKIDTLEPPKNSDTTSNGATPGASAQPSATPNGSTQNGQANAAPSDTPAAGDSAPVELGDKLRADIDHLKEFVNQRVAAREAEIARASLPPAPQAAPAPVDQTVQNLYLLNKATQSQQPVYTPRGSATPQPHTPAPTATPHVPIPGRPQGHMPHLPQPMGGAPNQTPGPGQPSDPPLAPGELPPNQTCPTSMLYDKARQAALSKSATHTRREGIHSTRRPWTPEEEKALMTGLDMVKGPHWSQILSLFGPNGTISDVLKDRTQVQLKDKARNLKLFFLKTQSEMPYYLSAVTGELKTRAPNQAARKEAEERARLSREEDQAKTQGNMAALVGQLQSATQGHGVQDVRQQQHQAQTQQPQQQHGAGVVTPAQAALAAHITTPAMAQGQAQSAQRPLQAAQPVQGKEQAPTQGSAPMAAPSQGQGQGSTVSAPLAQSQPHNRPSDGTVAALQELAKASASPVSGHASRVSSLAPAQGPTQARTTMGLQGQGQVQGQSQSQGYGQGQVQGQSQVQNQAQGHGQTQNQGQTQAHVQAQPAAAAPPQARPQAPAQPQQALQTQHAQQTHQAQQGPAQHTQHQARISASPGISGQAPAQPVASPPIQASKPSTPSPAPTAQAQHHHQHQHQHQQPATTAPAQPTSTKTSAPPPQATKTPAQPSAPSTSTSIPPTSSSIPSTSALAQLQGARSAPMTLSQSFPSTIPANLFSRVTEAEATNSGLLEKLRAEMAREARS